MKVDIAALERALWPNGPNRDVWMIVDPARDRSIYFDLLNSRLECSCLYSGNLSDQMEAVAPHLVQLVFEDKYTRALLTKAWGNAWGVLLHCEARMDRLRRHLRQFLVVNDWKHRRLVFRYYDPRVLRIFLPTCTGDELRTFFGPVTQFWAEDEAPEQLLQFGVDRRKLVVTKFPVAAEAKQATIGV